MLTVAVIAQKGGVGKTTLALHLAVEAARSGRAVIIDTDPQASAAQWADDRQSPQPAVVTCPASRLPVSLHAAKQSGARVAFIDTAPAVESPALAAVRAADFCLIVSRPGVLDLRSIGINVQIAKLAGKPVALVINAAPASGGQGFAAGEEAGRRYGVEICPIILHQRAVFGHALARSRCAQEVEPAGKAAAEVAALWDWLARRTSSGAAPERLSA
ncbi:MAG TPA: ParA family protein [Xanthobacteraceae bacterium]|jgi:chromosome partitioning protein